MSTDMYLHCISHDPPIISGAVGHTQDIPEIREHLSDREMIVAAYEKVREFVSFHLHYQQEEIVFMAQHPKCNLALFNEYGRQYSLKIGDDTNPIPE